MYEMMSGRPPYDGDSPVAVAIQHINGGAPLPSTLNPNIPGGLEQIIMKAMALETNDRYSGAAQMLADMDEFRKDPTILFDYNTPPLDAVIKIPNIPPVVHENPVPPRTTAERVVSRTEGQKRQGPKPDGQKRAPTGSDAMRRTGQTGATGVARNADAQRKAKAKAAAERRKREQEEEARNRVAIITIIICALVAIIAVVVLLVLLLGGGGKNNPEDELVFVPKLVGQEFEGIEDLYPDLDIRLLEEVYDENVEAGRILEQDPSAGTEVEPGRMVFVSVSLGAQPKEGTMGDLTNYTEDTAKSYLERLDMDLQVEVIPEFHDEIEAGKVIRTEPENGTALQEGQKIVLYVSQGQEIKTGAMPFVVDIPKDVAIRTLENQELKLDIKFEEVYDDKIVEGNVVRTTPDRGEELKTGQTVTLYISKGPELVEMPDLVGKELDTAKSLLEYAGFGAPTVVEIYSDKPVGQVLTQSVKKGEEVPMTTVITLEVSKGPEPTEPPAVTRDVVIDLRGKTAEGDVTVLIMRDGVEVYNGTVTMGTASITLTAQEGNGPQKYVVVIDGADSWDEWVDFAA